MIALQLGFPAGRFHATPWDRAVNEGEVEWPPSPWRLLRALVAGYHTAGVEDEERLHRLLDRLAAPPRYRLPPATAGHTRHYVPLGDLERTLILDAFVAIERTARAFVVWDDVALDEPERGLLERACSGVGYLGRAESWCRITVVDRVPDDEDLIDVDLVQRQTTDGPEVRRLGVAADYRGAGLLTALRLTTGAMRKERRLLPPGAAWLDYRFEHGFGLTPSLPQQAGRDRGAPLPDGGGLRFAIEGRTSSLRPPLTETLTLAEAFRAAAMKRYSAATKEVAPPVLSGKRDDKPLVGHDHAFILPRDLDDDGLIDHLDVWFATTVDHPTFLAVTGVSELWNYRLGDEKYAATYLGAPEPTRSRRWRSATPFLLGMHPRTRGSAERRARYEPQAQILASLGEHERLKADGRLDTRVSLWQHPGVIRHQRAGTTMLAAFRTARKRDRTIGVPLGATLEFDDERCGPIAIGRYAHFGMGQFVPDRDDG